MTDTIGHRGQVPLGVRGLATGPRLRARRDETRFRLEAPREVGGVKIVQVGRFTAGTPHQYAGAWVITWLEGATTLGGLEPYAVAVLVERDDAPTRARGRATSTTWELGSVASRHATLGQAQDALARWV